MYNEDVKVRFIEYWDSNHKTITDYNWVRYFFRVSEKFEECWNADICTRTKDELQPFYDEFMPLREAPRRQLRCLLSAYSKWCIENKIEGACNALQQSDSVSIERYRQCTVANPTQLNIFLNIVLDSENMDTIDNTVRALYWLLYSGIKKQDILRVRENDVDLSSMTVNYNGFSFPLYRESLLCIRKCMELKSFKIYRSNSDKVEIRPRGEGDILIRGTCRPVPQIKYWTATYRKKMHDRAPSDTLGFKYDSESIWLSGIFYRVYMDELAGIPPKFSWVVDQYHRRGKGRPVNKHDRTSIISDYMIDYELWKKSLVK